MEFFERMYALLPPVPSGRSAGVACAIGFVLGGIGLAVYLRNVIDLVLPVSFAIVATLLFGDIGFLAGALVGALHGYFRVHLSVARSGAESASAG